MIVINSKRQVLSTEDKYVRNKITGIVSKVTDALPTNTEADFEELDELPKYTEEAYKIKVRELIALKYPIEDELAVHRQRDTKPEEYAAYNEYCEECKVKAKEILSAKPEIEDDVINEVTEE